MLVVGTCFVEPASLKVWRDATANAHLVGFDLTRRMSKMFGFNNKIKIIKGTETSLWYTL